MKVKTLTLNSKEYPDLLRHIPGAPKKLYLLGNIDLLASEPKLSVVGSRKVTPYGRSITQDLVMSVAKYGIVIVSGLALGVDSIAHQACLDAGGKTIAVMPGGLDEIYPTSHYNLAQNILKQGGLLISEYPEGMPPMKQNFVARNRIVSGLSQAILITEANRQSGTIHTANFALEQGRNVLAVPGNITSPQSEGTNNLIRTGANPVTKASDIMEALGLDVTDRERAVFGSNESEQKLLELMQQGNSDSTELLNLSNLDVQLFNQTMSMLEITGKIRPLGGGHWAIK